MNLSNIYNDISITLSKQAGIKRVSKKKLAHKQYLVYSKESSLLIKKKFYMT